MSKQETEERNIEKNPYQKKKKKKLKRTRQQNKFITYRSYNFLAFPQNLYYRSPEDQTITKRETIRNSIVHHYLDHFSKIIIINKRNLFLFMRRNLL